MMKSKELRYIDGNVFMPVEYSEFKPNEDRHTCQYCGHKSIKPNEQYLSYQYPA